MMRLTFINTRSYRCLVLSHSVIKTKKTLSFFTDGPTNFSVSMDPPQVSEGDSVNLTCSSVANPAAVNYTWYKMTDDPSGMLQVGSGQVLSLLSMEASHTGLYICQARNSVGESNSTEGLLLTMKSRELRLGVCPFK